MRAYQRRIVGDVFQALGGGQRRLCVYLPTGGGKTRIAIEIIARFVLHYRRVIFMVNREPLVDQVRRRACSAQPGSPTLHERHESYRRIVRWHLLALASWSGSSRLANLVRHPRATTDVAHRRPPPRKATLMPRFRLRAYKL